MRTIANKLCLDVVVTAILAIALGVIFFVYPEETVGTIARIIAAIIFIFGVAQLAIGLVAKSGFSLMTAIGILIAAVGVWMFIYPKGFIGIIPFFIGLLILFHGLIGIKSSVDAGRIKYKHWGALFALSVITVITGALTILHAFDIVILTAKIVGVFLVYDGISGFIVVIRARLAIRRHERAVKDSEALDVPATIIDEDSQPL